MKFSLVFLMFFISNTGISQCLDFEVRDVSGNDVFNAQWNGIRICEDDKEISLGSETVYISRSSKNYYGDFIFNIQEARGYGWPDVGYVKVASTMDIVEVKFMNSIVRYGVVSPYQKALEEKLERERIELERANQLARDRQLYSRLDELIKLNQLKNAVVESTKLNFPEKYHNYNVIVNEKKRIAEEEQKLKILNDNLKLISDLVNQINKGDFNAATILFKQIDQKLNYTQEIYSKLKSAKNEIEKVAENDRVMLNNIKINISNKSLDSIFVHYNQLKLEENKQKIKSEIETFLSERNKTNFVVISKEKVTPFIDDNKSILAKLEPGKHTLFVNSIGDLFIDSILIKSGYKPLKFPYDSNNEFFLTSACKYYFEVTELKTNIGDSKLFSGSWKTVLEHPRGGYYLSGFLKKGRFHKQIPVSFSTQLGKNEFQVVQTIRVQKVIDGKILGEVNMDEIIKQGTFKRRIFNVSLKFSTILSGMSWGMLRLYESSLIN